MDLQGLKTVLDPISDWINDRNRRKVEIGREGISFTVWLYDYDFMQGSFVDNEKDLESKEAIESFLATEKEKEDRKKYEVLRQKYENKEEKTA